MKVFKEIKEIAKCTNKIKNLVDKLEEKMDTDDIDWNTAELVSLNKEQIKRLGSVVDDLYYCDQHQIYEDWFAGWLYFKTDVPGQYVKVHFEC